MDPFIEAQVNSLIEDLRLLEALVTAHQETRSDIQALRRSVPLPEAADLLMEEARRRDNYHKLTDDPASTVMETAGRAESILNVLESARRLYGAPLSHNWLSGARCVLTRVRDSAAADVRAKSAERVSGLYVIIDPEVTQGRPVDEVAEGALRGGAGVIQLRDKIHDGGGVLRTARRLKEACARRGAMFIMNDDAAVAFASGADGLHLGQTDLPVSDARQVLSDAQVVGRSNNDLEEVLGSQAAGVDYLAVGAVYATGTMGKSSRAAVGPALITRVKASVSQPVVAIGGINRGNVAEVVRAGADCVCVVSAVTMAECPEAAARAMRDAIESAGA